MCHRTSRTYRCGHTRRGNPDYCGDATYNHQTRRYSMCAHKNSTSVADDSTLCGRSECYTEDKRIQGWECHECDNQNPGQSEGGGRFCTRDGCWHEVCTSCTYATAW